MVSFIRGELIYLTFENHVFWAWAECLNLLENEKPGARSQNGIQEKQNLKYRMAPACLCVSACRQSF